MSFPTEAVKDLNCTSEVRDKVLEGKKHHRSQAGPRMSLAVPMGRRQHRVRLPDVKPALCPVPSPSPQEAAVTQDKGRGTRG